MIVDAALIGLAGVFVWALAAFLHTPIIRPVQSWLRRGWRKPLISCPWCSGTYLAIVGVVGLQWWKGTLDPVLTPITVLAAAALIGLIGSNWTPGFDDEDDEETPRAF